MKLAPSSVKVHTRDKPTGLGDVVAAVIHPFAQASDKLLGTNLAACVPCANKKEKLNAAIPDIRKPFSK